MNFKDREDYERWCRYGSERGWFDKTKDKVASWFGDEDAERRRHLDKVENDRQDRFNNTDNYGSTQYPARYGSQVGSSSYRFFESPWRETEPTWHRKANDRNLGRSYRNSFSDRYGSRYDDENYYPGNWGGESRGRESEFLNAAGGSLVSTNERFQRNERGRKGPRGYQRSDERISDDIHERIDRHLDIDARDVIIEVKDGDVTLRGSVSDRADKRLVEEIAEDVFGVKNVQNLLRINPDGFGEARLGSTNSVLNSGSSKLL